MTAIGLGATLLSFVLRGSLPYSEDNDCEQYEDERENGADNQGQHGKHQLSAPLLMI